MRKLALLPFLTLALACNDGALLQPDVGASYALTANGVLTPIEQLGKSIFFDVNLSIGGNQSCASCHGPGVGFTGPISDVNNAGAVYDGSISGRFGNRKPPSAAYATPSPILHYVMDKKDILFIGGNFWDGRATGEGLGNPAADQALGPFLNPAEQALPDNACIVHKVCTATPAAYPVSFESVWGPDTCDITWPSNVQNMCATEGTAVSLSDGDRASVETAYDGVGLAIAAYEASSEVNQYTSKYDAYLMGMADFTQEEKKGLQMFKAKAKCGNCHILDRGPNGEPPLFTDFTFDNLGVPQNPANPAGPGWVDLGLGGFLATHGGEYAAFAEDNLGKQKVPTLRNVDKRPTSGFVKAFTHNGYFKTLKGLVHFYNTRDLKDTCPGAFTEQEALAANCWPEPEVAENVNDDELGNLHLTSAQEDAIVTFLKTLSDGYITP